MTALVSAGSGQVNGAGIVGVSIAGRSGGVMRFVGIIAVEWRWGVRRRWNGGEEEMEWGLRRCTLVPHSAFSLQPLNALIVYSLYRYRFTSTSNDSHQP